MSGKRYTEEFKIGAVKQVVDRGYSVSSVASRLGVTTKSLYEWINRYGKSDSQHNQLTAQQQEIRALKADLRRVTDERDILKKAAAYFAKESQ
jgi:transposase